MKKKLNAFLNRTTSYDRTIIACIVTFLGAVLFTLAALITAIGGWHDLRLTAKFAEILAVVEHTYIGDADTEAVADAGFSAMIASLNDRWSYYMTAEQYENYQDHSSNQYTGIGITLQTMEDGSLVIMNVAADSPAEEAGMTAGLTLKELNGETLAGKTVQEISEEIKAFEGEFTLTAADEQGRIHTFTLSVAKVFSNPVDFRLLEGNIGYIQIKNFDEGCAEGAKNAVTELMAQGATALIFDVRDNGGGYVSELSELLDFLLPEGEIFISVNEDGAEKITSSDENCVALPMAVLVNASSYSAAEYFAAVLHEYGAASTVGEATTGKGRSQINVVLVDGSAVHISSRRYLTPGRVDLSEQGGIVPDIALELDENDNQLQAAMELFS